MPNLTGGQAIGGSNSFIRGTPWLNWWLIEQDHANNRSRIGVEMMINAGGYRWVKFHERGGYWINGALTAYDNGRQSRSGNFHVFRHEHHWVQHDANGNLHVSLTADCWIGDAKFVVENVNGYLPRLAKAPDIKYLKADRISSHGMRLCGEILNLGRGTSAQLQAQLVKSGDGWSAGGWQGWQNDVGGDNYWSVVNLAPNTHYSGRLVVKNNNGDQNETGEHKWLTLAETNIVRHKKKSPTTVELTLNTPASLNQAPIPTTKIEVWDGKTWTERYSYQRNGEYTVFIHNLTPNKEYQFRTAVYNASGVWRSEALTVKTLPACVIIKSDGTVLNCVPSIVRKNGEVVGLDPRVINKI